MTDPKLTEYLETEKAELEAILKADDEARAAEQAAEKIKSAEEFQSAQETPAEEQPRPRIKLRYVPNRHDRRRNEAVQRKSKSKK